MTLAQQTRTWRPLGKHRCSSDDGIFWLETHGEITPEDAGQIIELTLAMNERDPVLGMLSDVRFGITLPAETRRIMAASAHGGQQPLPTAVLGAGFPVRVLTTLLLNAVRIVGRYDSVPVQFFKEEDEAVVWVKAEAVKRGQRARAQNDSAARLKNP